MSSFIDINKWVPIHTLPGFSCCIEYYVSRDGQIKSTKGGKEKILRQVSTKGGYFKVTLQQRLGQKKPLQPYVHTLVALAFIGNPPTPQGRRIGCSVVDHKDENKKNNHVDNLHWISVKDNICKFNYAKFTSVEKTEAERIAQEKRDKYNSKLRTRRYRERLKSTPAALEEKRLKEIAKEQHRAKREIEIKEYKRKHRESIKADPEKLKAQREYQRDYMRRKRAAQKVAKIEESDT